MWLQCCVPNTGWKTSVWMLIKLQGLMCIWLANQLCIGTRESAECGLINCINVAWHNTLRKSHIFGNLSKQSLIFFYTERYIVQPIIILTVITDRYMYYSKIRKTNYFVQVKFVCRKKAANEVSLTDYFNFCCILHIN